MARFAVTMYLLFATVAGPSLCCCTPERWSAFFSARGERRPPMRSCCHFAEEFESAAARETPKEIPAPARPCPCEQERRRVLVIATATPVADPELALAFELISVAIVPPLSVAASVPRTDFSEPFRFLHSQDMLRAFSTWRC